MDVEDNVSALLNSKRGFLILLHLDFLQRRPKRFLRVVFEGGNLIWNLLTNSVTVEKAVGSEELIYNDPEYDKNEMYLEQLKDFAASTVHESEFKSTINSASGVMKLIAAIRRSSDENQWIDVAE